MRSKGILIIALVMIALATVACGPTEQAPVPEDRPEDGGLDAPLTREREMALQAKEIALQHPGVEAAFAVVASPETLLVGVRLEEGVSQEPLLSDIAARIRDEVDGIERVLISSDEDIVREIRDIQEALGDGHSVERYAEAIDGLAFRMESGGVRAPGQDSP